MKIKLGAILLFLFCILKTNGQSNYSLDMNTKLATADKMKINETAIGFKLTHKIDSTNSFSNTVTYKKTVVTYKLSKYNLMHDLNNFSSIENKLALNRVLSNKAIFNIHLKPILNFENKMKLSTIQWLGGTSVDYTINDKNNLSAGITRNVYFGNLRILPTMSYKAQLSKKIALEIGFPVSKLSYSYNYKNTFTVNNSFQGVIFNLDKPYSNYIGNTIASVTYSQMATTFEYIRNIDRYWSLYFQGGYNFNTNYYLSDDTGNRSYDFTNTNAYTLNIGIKLNINKQ